MGQRFQTLETFDKFEIQGDAIFSTAPLVQLVASRNNSWLQNKLLPLLYNGYPFSPSLTISRDTTAYGIPPLRALQLYNNDNSLYQLEDVDIIGGYAQTRPGASRFMYYISLIANQDYAELLNKASRVAINGGTNNAAISRLITTVYPQPDGNINYPVELKYRLPGTNKITSSITRNIYYKL